MDEPTPSALDTWISSYGLMTTVRVLETYGLSFSVDALRTVLGEPNSFYKALLEVPFAHLKNSLYLDEAHAYQLSAEKMLIDYFLNYDVSSEEMLENNTIMDLNEAHEALLEKNKALYAFEKGLYASITKAQSALINLVSEHQLNNAIEYKTILTNYFDEAKALQDEAKSHRQGFYESCLQINTLLNLLPRYQQNLNILAPFSDPIQP